MARDNFSQKVINNLRNRVANRCSNPDCRIPTTAPKGSNQVTSIGVAAHICAASSGGPRYDESMTSQERKSIDNAIWLCNNCSTLIDKNEASYSVAILKEWKKIADNTAYKELGKKLPDSNDAIDILSIALSGYPKKILMTAIENTHLATSRSLEQLDPRISVKTAFNENTLSLSLSAKEDVSIEIKINSIYSNEYAEKSRELFEHGKELKIDSEAIEIVGSPVIEKLFNNPNGVFSISPEKVSSVFRLFIAEKGTNNIEQFYDICGHITRGSKSATLTGVGCDGIFGLISTFYTESNTTKCDSRISINYNLWDGKLVNKLPFFEKIFSFINKATDNWCINSSLEIEGKVAYQGQCNDFFKSKKQIDPLLVFLNYTNRSIKIANRFKLDIRFDSNTVFTEKEHKAIAEVVNIIEGNCIYGKSNFKNKIRFEFIASEETSKFLSVGTTKVKIVTGQKDCISLFGADFELKRRVLIFNSVLVKANKKIIVAGEKYVLTLIPQEKFRLFVFYEDDTHPEDFKVLDETQI